MHVSFPAVVWTPAQLPDLTGRTAVVTGGNAGIGFHTARELAAHGARVVIACRDVGTGEAAAARMTGGPPVTVSRLDLASMGSIRTFADAWDGPLDLLVNNAGVMAPPKRRVTADGFEVQFATNHLGHYALTGLLLPALMLPGSARVVTVSSIAHQGGNDSVLDGNAAGPYNPQLAYSNSKLANLLFALELQRRLVEHAAPIVSVAAHPGVSSTGLFSDPEGMGASPVMRYLAPPLLKVLVQRPATAARAVLYAATEAEPGSYTGPTLMGETRGRIGPARISTSAQDEKLALRLWNASEEFTGLRYDWPPAPVDPR